MSTDPDLAAAPRVLIVDDEAQIRRALTASLTERGYDVGTAGTGEEAVQLVAQGRPDLVILDIGLPGMSGVEVVRSVRSWSSVPIIMLSVRGGERDKVEALDAGADDFVTKPFGMDELLARMRAALRRTPTADQEPRVVTDDFTIDLVTPRAERGGEEVHLTPTEWKILRLLVRNEGRLVSQQQLLRQVWGPQYGTETNYLRVYLAGLRRKLEPEPSRPRYLITEPGMGYRFQSGGDRPAG